MSDGWHYFLVVAPGTYSYELRLPSALSIGFAVGFIIGALAAFGYDDYQDLKVGGVAFHKPMNAFVWEDRTKCLAASPISFSPENLPASCSFRVTC